MDWATERWWDWHWWIPHSIQLSRVLDDVPSWRFRVLFGSLNSVQCEERSRILWGQSMWNDWCDDGMILWSKLTSELCYSSGVSNPPLLISSSSSPVVFAVLVFRILPSRPNVTLIVQIQSNGRWDEADQSIDSSAVWWRCCLFVVSSWWWSIRSWIFVNPISAIQNPFQPIKILRSLTALLYFSNIERIRNTTGQYLIWLVTSVRTQSPR